MSWSFSSLAFAIMGNIRSNSADRLLTSQFSHKFACFWFNFPCFHQIQIIIFDCFWWSLLALKFMNQQRLLLAWSIVFQTQFNYCFYALFNVHTLSEEHERFHRYQQSDLGLTHVNGTFKHISTLVWWVDKFLVIFHLTSEYDSSRTLLRWGFCAHFIWCLQTTKEKSFRVEPSRVFIKSLWFIKDWNDFKKKIPFRGLINFLLAMNESL